MSTELLPADAIYFKRLDKVAEMTLAGSSIAEMSRELGLTRKQTIDLQNDWRNSMVVDHEARDRALDALNVMDEHYNQLIQKTYKTLEQIEEDILLNGVTPQRIQQKLNALKLVADLEAKRLDALQKAGLLTAADMGDQVAEMEEKHQFIINILKHDLCPACRKNTAEKVGKLTGQVEPTVVYSE